MEISQITNEDLSKTYLREQAQGLLFEFNKLAKHGWACDSYIAEKLRNINNFLKEVGFEGRL